MFRFFFRFLLLFLKRLAADSSVQTLYPQRRLQLPQTLAITLKSIRRVYRRKVFRKNKSFN